MISTITIGFSRPRNRILPIASWLIRLHQKTPYSHVYIRFYSESINRTLIYEAVGSGTRFVSLKKWEEKAEEIQSFTISVRKCNAVSLLQYCVDHAGQEYGFLQNVGIFLANVFGWKKNPFRKGTNCAEEIGNILVLEGYKVSKPLDLLSPKDIEQILLSGK
jgi:hypothetical protein